MEGINSCLQNLDRCKASCCHHIAFDIGSISEDHKRYYNFHEGVRVEGNLVIVETRCRMLTKENKCKLHFRGKPAACVNDPGSEETYVTENCRFKK